MPSRERRTIPAPHLAAGQEERGSVAPMGQFNAARLIIAFMLGGGSWSNSFGFACRLTVGVSSVRNHYRLRSIRRDVSRLVERIAGL